MHAIAAESAGPLWRDEANTVALATGGTAGDVWKNLQYDSFPLLWPLIVRWYSNLVGPMNDSAFRVFGFITGVGLLGALWLVARTFGYRRPLVAIALLGMHPAVIRWGGSFRGYGLGMVAIICAVALVWRYVEQPTHGRLASAAVASIISVHLLYYNSVLLLAFGLAAIVVFMRRHAWRHAAMIAVIGLLAALSLLPYAGVIRSAAGWNALVRIADFSPSFFFAKLNQTLEAAGFWSLLVWVDATVMALLVAVVVAAHRRTVTTHERERLSFAAVALLIGSLGTFWFLRILSYGTHPWYFLTLMTCVAVCADIIFGVAVRSRGGRLCKAAIVSLLAAATFLVGRKPLTSPLSNVRQASEVLEKIARPSDLVVVTPWEFGVTFDRYYRGRAPWKTLPDLSFHHFHRYDMVKAAMQKEDQLDPIRIPLDEALATLEQGGRVFIAGVPGRVSDSSRVELRGPAPAPDGQWPEHLYQTQWTNTFTQYVKQHSAKLDTLSGYRVTNVSRYETMVVLVAEGWRR
jgi:hypothetical protein